MPESTRASPCGVAGSEGGVVFGWKIVLFVGEDGEPEGFDAGGAPGIKMWDSVARRGLFGIGTITSVSEDRFEVLVWGAAIDNEAKEDEEGDSGGGMTKFGSAFLLIFRL